MAETIEHGLTREQLNRQDMVDAEIFGLLIRLAWQPVEWDIEMIGSIRGAVQEAVCDVTGMSEMEFYPYLEEEE